VSASTRSLSSPGLTGRSIIPVAVVFEPRRHGVLDSPPSRGMTLEDDAIAHYSVIASAAKKSRNASMQIVWIASSQGLLVMTMWRQFRSLALGFRHHRPAGADIAPLE